MGAQEEFQKIKAEADARERVKRGLPAQQQPGGDKLDQWGRPVGVGYENAAGYRQGMTQWQWENTLNQGLAPDVQDYVYGSAAQRPEVQQELARADNLMDNAARRRNALEGQAAGYNQGAQQAFSGAQQGYQNQSPEQQRAAYNALMQAGQQGPGPSAAEAQMRMGQDAAMAQALAMARSGRGAGNQAQLARQAQFQGAGLAQQTAAQTSLLRAQETDAYRNRQLQAFGAAGTLAGQQRGQDLQAAAGQTELGSAQGNLGNAATGQAFNYNQAAMQAEALRQQEIQTAQNMRMAYNAQLANNYSAYKNAENGAKDSNGTAAIFSALGTAVGSGVGLMAGGPAGAVAGGTIGGSAGRGIGGMTDSDIRMKKNIQFDSPDVKQPNYEALDRAYGRPPETDFRQAKGALYEYKPEFQSEANPPGPHYGPMADDLQHIPGVVKPDPNTGMKSVDTGRLTLANTAGISEQQRRLDELQAELEALRSGRSEYPTPQQPNLEGGQVLSDEHSKQQIGQLQRENAILKGKYTLVPPPSYGERPSTAGVTTQPGYMSPGRGTGVPPPSYSNYVRLPDQNVSNVDVQLPEQKVTGTKAVDPTTQRQLEALRYARQQQSAGGA